MKPEKNKIAESIKSVAELTDKLHSVEEILAECSPEECEEIHEHLTTVSDQLQDILYKHLFNHLR